MKLPALLVTLFAIIGLMLAAPATSHAADKAEPTFVVTNKLPHVISKNLGNNFSYEENAITSIDAEQLVRHPDNPNRLAQRIKADSIKQPGHMAIIRVDFTWDATRGGLDVSRNSKASRKPAVLKDSHGQSWKPIAFVRAMPGNDQHILIYKPGIKTIRDLLIFKMGRKDTFHLYYMVQRPSRITQYDFGQGLVDLETPIEIK